MSDAPKPEDSQLKDRPDASNKGDALALGIGCLVVVIFFVAIAFFSYARG